MRCDSILKGGRGRGICGKEKAFNWSAKCAVQISPIASCTFVQIDERNDQMHTVVSSVRVIAGRQGGFIALSPSLHL